MSYRISAAKTPLDGWCAQVWVASINRWCAMNGCPFFKNPDDAISWGKDQFSGWPE